jgi:histidine triad (HIT) family protein
MDCLFCKIIKKEIPAKIEYEDNEIIAIDDINPKAPIHILIIPKKHISNALDVKGKDAELIGKLVIKASDLAREKGISKSGFRLIFNSGPDSGQEVDHIHLHLLGGKPLGPMVCG